jgi:hypothetical protein
MDSILYARAVQQPSAYRHLWYNSRVAAWDLRTRKRFYLDCMQSLLVHLCCLYLGYCTTEAAQVHRPAL